MFTQKVFSNFVPIEVSPFSLLSVIFCQEIFAVHKRGSTPATSKEADVGYGYVYGCGCECLCRYGCGYGSGVVVAGVGMLTSTCSGAIATAPTFKVWLGAGTKVTK